jgi:hypothetical protein
MFVSHDHLKERFNFLKKKYNQNVKIDFPASERREKKKKKNMKENEEVFQGKVKNTQING